MGLIDRWARLASVAPAVANVVARSGPAKWLAGLDSRATPPAFARQSFRRWFRRRKAAPRGGERVLLWPDTFNNHFRPETLIAATELLERAGFEVSIPHQPLCCGRPLYDWGFLEQARRRLERILAATRSEIAAGVPLVTVEPACASVFKDELPNLVGGRADALKLSGQTHYIADFVADRLDRFPDAKRGGSALVQAHCHHHSVIGLDKELELLDRLGVKVERPQQGCCGMAGAFGMAAETYDLGRKIGERALLPRVRALDDDMLVIADGFSCREQIEMHGKRRTTHIVELLRYRLAGAADSSKV
jgi:Fe-S oxidoreductase